MIEPVSENVNLLFPGAGAQLDSGHDLHSQLPSDPEGFVQRTHIVMIGNADGGQSDFLRTHQYLVGRTRAVGKGRVDMKISPPHVA
jgi:hypothetical protein